MRVGSPPLCVTCILFMVILKLPYKLSDLCMTIRIILLPQNDWVIMLLYFQAIHFHSYCVTSTIYCYFLRGWLSGNSVFLTNTPCWSYKPSLPQNSRGSLILSTFFSLTSCCINQPNLIIRFKYLRIKSTPPSSKPSPFFVGIAELIVIHKKWASISL